MRFAVLGALAGALFGIYCFFIAVDSGPNFEPPGLRQALATLWEDLSAGGGRTVFTLAILTLFGGVGAVPGGVVGGLVGWFVVYRPSDSESELTPR